MGKPICLYYTNKTNATATHYTRNWNIGSKKRASTIIKGV